MSSVTKKIPRPLACAVAAIGIVLTVIAFQLAHAPNIDDSFILDVYIRHLASTGSFFWNLRDGHVDGCTSILDLVVKTLIFRFVGGDIARLDWSVVFILMILGTAAATWLTVRLAERFTSRLDRLVIATALTGALALATNRATIDGAKMLLEPPLFLLTLFAALALQLLSNELTRRRLIGLGVAWVCVALARPEGLALVVVFAVFFWWRERSRFASRDLALPIALAGGCLAAYFIWHTIYFGYWAPNTYYAKKSDSRWFEILDGYGYVDWYVRTQGWARIAIGSVLLAPLLLAMRSWQNARAREVYGFLSLTAIVNLATIVYAGGDCYWGYARFLSTCVTLTMLALVVAGAALDGPARFVGLTALGCMVIASVLAMFEAAKWDSNAHAMSLEAIGPPDMTCHREGAQAIASLGLSQVAQTDFQNLKYFHDELEVIDASGLNDKVAAHLPAPGHVLGGKGGIPYAVDRRAEVFALGPWIFTPTPMAQFPDDEVVRDNTMSFHFMAVTVAPENWTRLASSYRGISLPACNGYVNVWVRRDLAERFVERPGIVLSPPPLPFSISLEQSDEKMRGFWPPEKAGADTSRWTKGDAELSIDIREGLSSRGTCTFAVSMGPESEPPHVLLDGKELTREATFVSRWDVQGRALTPGPHLLRITSPTVFRYGRDVGVKLTGLRFGCVS